MPSFSCEAHSPLAQVIPAVVVPLTYNSNQGLFFPKMKSLWDAHWISSPRAPRSSAISWMCLPVEGATQLIQPSQCHMWTVVTQCTRALFGQSLVCWPLELTQCLLLNLLKIWVIQHFQKGIKLLAWIWFCYAPLNVQAGQICSTFLCSEYSLWLLVNYCHNLAEKQLYKEREFFFFVSGKKFFSRSSFQGRMEPMETCTVMWPRAHMFYSLIAIF